MTAVALGGWPTLSSGSPGSAGRRPGAAGSYRVGMFDADADPYFATPWVAGPAELLAFALDVVESDDDDVSRRVGMVLLDNAVEVMAKALLTLPTHLGGAGRKKAAVKALGFYSALKELEAMSSSYFEGAAIAHLTYYHDIRNDLYHGDTGTTPTRDNVNRFAHVARVLFTNLYGVAAPSPRSASGGATKPSLRDRELELLVELRAQRAPDVDDEVANSSKLEELRRRLAEQVAMERESDEIEPPEGAAQLVSEVETYLRLRQAALADEPSNPSLEDAFYHAVSQVEASMRALLEELGADETRPTFGDLLADVTPAIDRDLVDQLGALAVIRNGVAHGVHRLHTRQAVELANRALVELQHRREALTDADRERWRQQHRR